MVKLMAKKKAPTKKNPSAKKKTAKKKDVKSGTNRSKTRKPSRPKEENQLKILKKIENQSEKLREEITDLKKKAREQTKQLNSLDNRLETRVKREEVIMKALRITSRTKKGEAGVIGELNSSILKAEKYMLHMGKRIDNVLAAIKNHREYLIKLNKKVHKEDAKKGIEMEVDIINNTLSVMALSGFDINKTLFSDVKRIRKMMEKKDVELTKLRKRKERLERKFEDEMERFDYESIYKKSEYIPGYR
jgi:hypothetical protein